MGYRFALYTIQDFTPFFICIHKQYKYDFDLINGLNISVEICGLRNYIIDNWLFHLLIHVIISLKIKLNDHPHAWLVLSVVYI